MINYEVYWYREPRPPAKALSEDRRVDVVVIGGGMTGLMCAQQFMQANKKVAVIEQSFCGGGASGKSSGFMTPDSELELSDLTNNYGEDLGKQLWEFAKHGLEAIRKNIIEYQIACDYQVQDSLFIANSKSGIKTVKEEYRVQTEFGYQSKFYDSSQLTEVINSNGYFAAVRYPNTYGMNAYAYCQGFKQILGQAGVEIYEGTKVTAINNSGVVAGTHRVDADAVVVCTDQFMPQPGIASPAVYHAQTFLSISKPLTDAQVKQIFPESNLMVWDTSVIYQYFRMTGEKRLLLGSADLLYTYLPFVIDRSRRITKKIQNYLKTKFPQVPIEIDYLWPGLIGVSKDFAPIFGKSQKFSNVFFAGAGAGLPWSAALGKYAADKIIFGRSEFDSIFNPDRRYPIGSGLQNILTKPLSFAISHGIKKYF